MNKIGEGEVPILGALPKNEGRFFENKLALIHFRKVIVVGQTSQKFIYGKFTCRIRRKLFISENELLLFPSLNLKFFQIRIFGNELAGKSIEKLNRHFLPLACLFAGGDTPNAKLGGSDRNPPG